MTTKNKHAAFPLVVYVFTKVDNKNWSKSEMIGDSCNNGDNAFCIDLVC